jgi:nicotinamide-nucleotide amidase
MHGAILTIGNELTSGRTQDTNSSYIAREMNARGWPISIMMSVGDSEDAIKKALDYLMGSADTIIVTGGLGPTADDITTAAIATAFGRGLYTDEAVLAHIKGIFDRYRLKWTENNAKQAVFPEGAQTIRNPVGTAFGFSLTIGGKVIVVIPGVPFEIKRMIPEEVIPLLMEKFPAAVKQMERRTIKLFGLGEAVVDEALADVDLVSLGVEIGFYPNFPENHVVLIARHEEKSRAKENIENAVQQVKTRLRDYIFAYDEESLEGLVAALLTEKKLTLAVAESCTGGLITDRLTDIPGSSVFLERGVVTYSNAAKIKLLGVPEAIIRDYGAVSEETATLMAEGVRRLAGTDLGLSVTGIAGPGGGSELKPVGTVFIALADGTGTICRQFAWRWDRRRIKVISSQAALIMLKNYLTGEPHHG